MSVKSVQKLSELTGSGPENLEKLKQSSKDPSTNFGERFSYTDLTDFTNILHSTKTGNYFHFCVSSRNGQGNKLKMIEQGLSELVKNVEDFAEKLSKLNHTVIDALKAYNSDGETALHIAARLGRLDMVNTLIKLGADVKQPCDNVLVSSQDPSTGDTPMILAIKGCHKNSNSEEALLNMLIRLVHSGGDIKQENAAHQTVLLLAIEYRYMKVFNYLIDKLGLIPPQIDHFKRPILFELFNCKDSKSRDFLRRFAEIPTTDFKILALTADINIFHDAAASGDIEALTAISEGLGNLPKDKPNITVKEALCERSQKEFTPLHKAVCLGYCNCVTLLVEKLGADWESPAKEGSLEKVAIAHGRYEVANYLKLLRYKNSLIQCLTDRAFTEAYQFHIYSMTNKNPSTEEIKKKVEERDPLTGNTPLLALFSSSSPEIEEQVFNLAEILLKAGADPNAKNDEGTTAIALSLLCGYKKVFNLLLPKSNLALPYSKNSKLLHQVAGCSGDKIKIALLETLINKMLDKDPLSINATNTIHHTPLFEVEDPDVLRCFLKNGAKATQEVANYFFTKKNRTVLLPILKEFNQEINYEERLQKEETLSEHVLRSASNSGHSLLNAGGVAGQGVLDLTSAGLKIAGDAALDLAKNKITGGSGK